jgi:hypothetical protein
MSAAAVTEFDVEVRDYLVPLNDKERAKRYRDRRKQANKKVLVSLPTGHKEKTFTFNDGTVWRACSNDGCMWGKGSKTHCTTKEPSASTPVHEVDAVAFRSSHYYKAAATYKVPAQMPWKPYPLRLPKVTPWSFGSHFVDAVSDSGHVFKTPPTESTFETWKIGNPRGKQVKVNTNHKNFVVVPVMSKTWNNQQFYLMLIERMDCRACPITDPCLRPGGSVQDVNRVMGTFPDKKLGKTRGKLHNIGGRWCKCEKCLAKRKG